MNQSIKPSLIALAVAQSISAQAATLEVTSILDDGSACTLREAIATINAGSDQSNGCGVGTGAGLGTNDTIEFASGIQGGTIGLTSGYLYIREDMVINSSGIQTIIDAGGNSQVMRIYGYPANGVINVNLNGLKLTGGYFSGSLGPGGIEARVTNLTIENSVISNNTTTHENSRGGAIRFTGSVGTSLTIINSEITANQAASSGGGIVTSVGSVDIQNSTISGNTLTGSGYYAYGGGGIAGFSGSSITISNSTLSNNIANGAGMEGGSMLVEGSASVTNSTISGNQAQRGGGVRASGFGSVSINNSTLANNSSQYGGSDIYARGSSTFEITNSIAADKSGGAANCSVGPSATVIAATDSIIEEDNCGTTAMNVDPALGLLADNGGSTMTHALLTGSVAIDGATGAGATTLDQRGYAIAGVRRDIGAFEYVGTDPNFSLSITVDSTADDDGAGCTLREAIDVVNQRIDLSNGCGFLMGPSSEDTTINFDSSINNGTISLTGGVLDIDESVNILGGSSNITLNGTNAQMFLLHEPDTEIGISNLTLANAIAPANNGGAIYARYATKVELSEVTITGASAFRGAAVFSRDGAEVTVIDSTITGNSANNGNGAAGGFYASNGTVTAINSTIFNNGGGGAVAGANGFLKFINSTVSGNSSTFGAGIYVNTASLNMINSTVANNTSTSSTRGDVSVQFNSSAYFRNSVISSPSLGAPACQAGNGSTVNGDSSNLFQENIGCGVGVLTGNPDLGSLQDNGGLTLTHEPFANSPLIDAGNDTICAADPINNLDQRGETRPEKTACDIGAVERFDSPPQVDTSINDQTVDEDDEPLVFDLSSVFSDPDNDDLTFSVVENTNGALFSTDLDGDELSIFMNPDENGEGDITVRAEAFGKFVEDTFTITVEPINDPPEVGDTIEDVTVDEDAAPVMIDLIPAFFDIDDPTLFYSISFNSNETLVSTSIEDDVLELSFTAEASGTATITVLAEDEVLDFAEQTFLVTVNPIDDLPFVVTPIDDVTVDEDDPASMIDLSGVFDDIDSDPIDLTIESNSNSGLVTPSLIGADLTLTYLPDQNGSAEITIRATADGEFVEDTFTVNVNSINDAPVITSASFFEFEDGVAEVGEVTATDVEMDPVTFMLAGGDDAALFNLTSDGMLSFIDAPDINTPLDFDGNNEYEIIVQAFDGVDTTEQAVTIVPMANDECDFFIIPAQNGKMAVVCL